MFCFGRVCWVCAGWMLCTSLQLGCFFLGSRTRTLLVRDAVRKGEFWLPQARAGSPRFWRRLQALPGLAGWVGPFWGFVFGGIDVFPPRHTDFLMDCKGYTVVDPLHCSPTFGFLFFFSKFSVFFRLDSVHPKIRTIQLFPLP